MEDTEEKFRNTLSDIDIVLTLRSAKADLVVLQKLRQVIVTSIKDLVDTEIAYVEQFDSIRSVSGKSLRVSNCKLYID